MTETAAKTDTTNALIFDRQPCGRCGGSGRYSFNQMDGDRCYGCSGSGVQIVPKHRKMADEWFKAMREVKRPVVGDLAVGDQVARDGQWVAVTSITVDEQVPRSSTMKDGEWVATSYMAVVRYADGDLQHTSTSSIVRRKATTEAVIARVSAKTAAHVRARRAAAGLE